MTNPLPAHQPGDGLPPSESPAPPLVDLPGMTSHRAMALEINQLVTERDALYGQVASLKSDLLDKETSNRVLRGALDDLRRVNAKLVAQAASHPADELAELRARIDELAAIVLEPIPYALVESVSAPVKVEVFTAVQNISGGERFKANNALAAWLNDGWEIIPALSGVQTFVDSSGDYAVQVDQRIVTLTREVEDDDAGDAPEAAVSVEPADEAQPLPAAVPDTRPVAVAETAPSFSLNGLGAALDPGFGTQSPLVPDQADAQARADATVLVGPPTRILSSVPLLMVPIETCPS